MSAAGDTLTIGPDEAGLVRVFAIDPAIERPSLVDVERALATPLDPAQVDILRVEDLGDLGLSGYLSEGIGVSPEAIGADRARLDGLKGHVAVIRSAAFIDKPARLEVRAPLRWIGTWPETGAASGIRPMPPAPAGEAAEEARAELDTAALAPLRRAYGWLLLAALLVIVLVTLLAR